MLPGKKYKPEDLLWIARRNFWIIAIPFAVVAAGTAYVARKLPDRYMSKATVLVVPQQLNTDIVRPVASLRLDEKLRSINDEMLSRVKLERIIEELNLYPQERKAGIMEDIVEQMRRDIAINLQGGDTFSVAYYSDKPVTAQKVADRLANNFIDENVKSADTLAVSATQFLESETTDMRRKLQDQEKQLENFRQQYAGQLPSQQDSNLTDLQATNQQIQNYIESENRDHSESLTIKRLMADLQTPEAIAAASAVPAAGVSADGQPTGSAQSQLAAYQAQLRALENLGYKDTRPEIRTLKKSIAEAQAKVDQESLQHPVSDPSVTPAEAARQRKLAEYQSRLDLLDRQIAFDQTKERELKSHAEDLLQRLGQVPARESELTELMRDYDTLRKMYDDLLAKKEAAAMANSLQNRQLADSFRILDPARVPERPASPNRPVINLMGMVAGMAIGVLLVAFREYRDSSFRSDEEVSKLLGLKVLAVVPSMQSVPEKRRASRRLWFLNTVLAGTVMVCFAIVAYTFVFAR